VATCPCRLTMPIRAVGRVQNLFYATERQLAADPAGGVIGPDEWTDIFLETGYYEQTWVQWGQAFSDWVNEHNAAAADELIQLYQAVDAPMVGDPALLGLVKTFPTTWLTSSAPQLSLRNAMKELGPGGLVNSRKRWSALCVEQDTPGARDSDLARAGHSNRRRLLFTLTRGSVMSRHCRSREGRVDAACWSGSESPAAGCVRALR
jgi:hypothetical protein